MKRVWKISDAKQAELLLCRCYGKPQTLTLTITNPLVHFTVTSSQRFTRELFSKPRSCPSTFQNIIDLFVEKWSYVYPIAREDLSKKVSKLSDELLRNADDFDKISNTLEEDGASLFTSYSDGSALVELLKQLSSWPQLALEVFNWRRNQTAFSIPMTPGEYA